MPTLVLDPPPPDFEALLERRRQIGLDKHDEVWEGVLHLGPAPLRRHARLQMQVIARLEPAALAAGLEPVMEFNLGEPDDFRIPDGGLLEPGPDALYLSTAALVAEVLSPNDETRQKLPFYAAHGVQEIVIVDPETHTVEWLRLSSGSYQPTAHSTVIELSASALTQQLDWPN
ncbi:MAG: Uma2 family endonuclease [Solirubrobacterales bacterium]|nr:Uma2 family endonuclease [Solirubrobacterales bacterium]